MSTSQGLSSIISSTATNVCKITLKYTHYLKFASLAAWLQYITLSEEQYENRQWTVEQVNYSPPPSMNL